MFLACCKPIIRKNANIGDWIVSTGSKRSVGNDKLVYAMKITEKMDFNEYYHNPKFTGKLTTFIIKIRIFGYKMRTHSMMKTIWNMILSGLYVLISNNFYYFGKKAVKIPVELHELIKKEPGPQIKF